MRGYLIRRLLQAVVVVIGVVIITFGVARLVPGDPAVTYAGPRASKAELEQVRRNLHLDAPWPQQLLDYGEGVATGDWGTALHTRRPVLDDLRTAFPASVELVAWAMLLAAAVGVPAGMLAAQRQGSAADTLIRVLSMASVSMPVFWLALILQNVFFQRLGILPVAGRYDAGLDYTHPLTVYTHLVTVDALFTGNWAVLGSALSHLVLPALAVGAYPAGAIAQMTRASLIEEAQEDHVRMARALGFGDRAIYTRLAMRPALNPVVALAALVFAYSLANTFLVEAIFNWPGLGAYSAAAIGSLDTPAILGVTLLVSLSYVLLNLVVDLVQAAIDPRVVRTR